MVLFLKAFIYLFYSYSDSKGTKQIPSYGLKYLFLKFENGSNMIVTIVYHLLEDFLKDHGKLPKKLHLNLDNCWRENKNRFLFSFLEALLHLNIFVEVTCNFLLGKPLIYVIDQTREAIKIENPVISGNRPDWFAPPPPHHFSWNEKFKWFPDFHPRRPLKIWKKIE